MSGIEFNGSVGPQFWLLLIGAVCALYVAVKYKTNGALKEAANGWRENAEAQESRGDRLEQDLSRLHQDFNHARVELDDLKKRAPDLKALYELSNLNTRLAQENSATLKDVATQMQRMTTGIDEVVKHVAALRA